MVNGAYGEFQYVHRPRQAARAIQNGPLSVISNQIAFTPNINYFPGELITVGLKGCASFTFSDSGQMLGSFESRGVRIGDLDALFANAMTGGEANRVYTNSGSGLFTDSGQALGSSVSIGVRTGYSSEDMLPGTVAQQAGTIFVQGFIFVRGDADRSRVNHAG